MLAVDGLAASLRAIETSANAVATEQVIAQRTLASSEEALETLEAGDPRARLEEDIEALRTSLVSIEARLHEVQKARCVCISVFIDPPASLSCVCACARASDEFWMLVCAWCV